MKRIVWLTDIHLNFVPRDEVHDFLHRVAEQRPDAVLITGDIAESSDVGQYLGSMTSLRCPIYFVLGNHDYYFSSIAAVRAEVEKLCCQLPNLYFLTGGAVGELAAGVGIVGHDGWADARYGDYLRSYVMMHDYRLIEELAGHDKLARRQVLHELGDAAAAAMRPRLTEALDHYPEVYLLTHVPPLLEACWHAGRISDSQWSPHFTCKAMGDAILEIMHDYPQRQLTVLCGHTHGSGTCQPAPNVVIHTGGAEYGNPGIVKVWEIG